MIRRQLCSYTSLFLVLIALSFNGCDWGSPQSNKAKLLEQSQSYYDNGQYAEAIIALRNLTNLDPNNAEAHYRLALAHLKQGRTENLQSAFIELKRTIELDTTNQDAQLKLGELYLLGRDPAKAREQADIFLVTAPQNTEGLILRGRSLITEHRYQEGIEELRKAIQLDPKNMQTYIDLSRAHFAAKDQAAAESALNQALTVNPRSTEIMLALGDFRAITGKTDQAEILYKQALAIAPENDSIYWRLTELYQRQKKLAEAEAMLQKLASNKPQDEKPHVQLGDFFRSTGQADKAIASYQKALDLNANSALARDKLISFYLDSGKVEEATSRTKAILDKNSKDQSGRFFNARIHLAKGNADEAVSILQGVVKDEPGFAGAHHFLGMAFLKKHQTAQARAAFAEAVKHNPNMADARIALAKIHMAEGAPDLALEQAQAVIQLQPQNTQAAVIAGDAYLRKGDIAKSKQVFEAVAKNLPNEPVGYYRLGLVARAEKNDVKALTYFQEALQRRPSAVDALNQIVAIKVAQGKPAEARERIIKQIETDPKNPHFHNLLGQQWMKANDPSQAAIAFKKAIDLDNAVLTAYVNLGQAYQQAGKTDEAVKEFEAVLSKNPKVVQAHMFLGVISGSRQEYAKAQSHYEEALKIDPRFAPAANNLAWLLTERGGNLDVALAHAQTAREVRPDDPSVADTLGWVYYKKNAYLLAINLLREAAEKLPQEPVVHYHLGMALSKNGETVDAKKSLETALKLKADFQGSDEAKKTLAGI